MSSIYAGTITTTTTLDQVTHDTVTNTVTVTWRDRLFNNGVEVDAARVMRQVTYDSSMIAQFNSDLGSDAATYVGLFGAV